MSLKSCEKAEEANVYSLVFGLSGDEFKGAIAKAYLKNRGKYNVPGFRKGKAPKHIIENYYGKEAFWYDAVDMVYPDLFESAAEEGGITPVSAPFEDKVDEINEDGFTISLKVYVKPEAEVKKYKGLSAEKDKVSVKKSEVKDEVQKALEKDAKVVTVEDRAAEKGDTATIDFEGFVDGKAFEGGKGEDHELELGSGSFIPGFEDQVIGHSTGDAFDVNVKFPEEYGAEELANKDATFKVTLKKLTKKVLPEYDDEFVKDVSEFDTIEAYEKSLEDEIKSRKQSAADRDFDNAVLEKLIENTTVEVPDAMIQKEIDNQLNEFGYRLQMQGMSLDMYLQYTGMKTEDLRASYKESAEKQVKLRLALEKIAELEKLEVSDEDVETELKTYADSYGMTVEKVKEYVSDKSVREDLVCRKAMDLVKDSASAAPKKKAAKGEGEEASEEANEESAEVTAKEAKPAAKAKTKAAPKKAEKVASDEKADAKPAKETRTTAKKPAAKKAAPKAKKDEE